MKFARAFVITLPESAGRRKRLQEAARRSGLEVEWYPAIRGSEVDIADYQQRGYLSEDFQLRAAGSLGTLLSHLTLWEKVAAAGGCEKVLIFEDDAIIRNGFLSKLEQIPEESLPEDWDMAWLGWHRLYCDPVNDHWGKPKQEIKIGTNSGHFAYLMRVESLSKLKAILTPYDNKRSKDNVLRRNFQNFGAYFLLKRISRTPLFEFDSTRKNINNPKRSQKFRYRMGRRISRFLYRS